MLRDIKLIREKYSYTQERLAELLDVSVSTVRAWEQGVNTKAGRRSKKDIEKTFPELTIEEVDNLFNEEVL